MALASIGREIWYDLGRKEEVEDEGLEWGRMPQSVEPGHDGRPKLQVCLDMVGA